MDGRIIRSKGIQTFLNNCLASKFANINLNATQQEIARRWNARDMGCHDPAYRNPARRINLHEFINTLEKLDPSKGLATGYVDGLVTTADRMVLGTERTAEGLGSKGMPRIEQIGEENSVAYQLVKDALVKAFTLSLNLVNNPLTALLISILTYYTKYIPDEIIINLAAHGKFKNFDIDLQMVIQADIKGLNNIDVSGIAANELKRVGSYLNDNPQILLKYIGKREGRKMATQIATIIAISVAKQIAIRMAMTRRYKSFLKQIKPGSSTKALAGVLVFLLKTQGLLQQASNSSQHLHNRSPLLWQQLRKLDGLDMIYFFVEDYIGELVDRIGLAERNPERFLEMIIKILQPPGTAKDLFFLTR